jgi:4-hydroxyphenylacetate 3-monooxygenase
MAVGSDALALNGSASAVNVSYGNQSRYSGNYQEWPIVIRTGEQYRESLRDGRQVWIDGERVHDVSSHPAFKPIVDARARIYDLAHEPETQDVMSYRDPATGERCPTGAKLPVSKDDWRAKRTAVDTVLDDLGGIVTRVGDETVGEMWSLYDGQAVLDEIDPAFAEHIRRHVAFAAAADPFHVSANTDPKGDRARRPQDQDPDVLLHAVRETPNGIVVRGAKFETAAAYANQAFVKPTIGDWGDQELSDYAVGFIADMGAPGVRHICRSSFAGRGDEADYPLSGRFDEIDTMIVFDDVEIPWENVLFYRHTRAAAFIRATLHRYSMFPFVQRHLRFADLLVGIAHTNAVQTGVKMHQGVREKLAELVCFRESINAHLTAAVEMAEPSPGGLLMPNQALLYTGRVLACTQLPAMMHLARDLCGGQLCVTPSAASFADPEAGPWLNKYLSIDGVAAEDRRRLFAFARDLLNSDYAGHRLTFQLFAQSPAFAHLLAVYNNYDFEGPDALVRRYAGLPEPSAPEERVSASG